MAPPAIYPLSLHDALPIWLVADRGPAGAHGGRELREAPHHERRGEEVDRRGDAARRAPVEEHGGGGREPVAVPVLGEQPVHHQEVGEDPYPAFRRGAATAKTIAAPAPMAVNRSRSTAARSASVF